MAHSLKSTQLRLVCLIYRSPHKLIMPLCSFIISERKTIKYSWTLLESATTASSHMEIQTTIAWSTFVAQPYNIRTLWSFWYMLLRGNHFTILNNKWVYLHTVPTTLREESNQTYVILQYKLLASIVSAVCSVIHQS